MVEESAEMFPSPSPAPILEESSDWHSFASPAAIMSPQELSSSGSAGLIATAGPTDSFTSNTLSEALPPRSGGSSSVIASKRMVNSFGAKSAAEKSRDLSGYVDTGYGYRPQKTASEAYEKITDNAFKNVSDEPLSTVSIDVDTASYTNLRRFLNQGRLPPPAAVRIEEMLNYFT